MQGSRQKQNFMISGVTSASNSFITPKPFQTISKLEEGLKCSCAATSYICKDGYEKFLSV